MQCVWVKDGGQLVDAGELRAEFLRLMTEDSETKDGRRRDFNQAIFMPEGGRGGGRSIWSHTDLGMVMGKFDRAVKNLGAR